MAEKYISTRNLKFLLYDVFDATSLTRHPYFKQSARKPNASNKVLLPTPFLPITAVMGVSGAAC